MSPEETTRRLSWTLRGGYEWLAWQAGRRWVAVILIAGILAVDLGLPWQGWAFPVRAVLDAPCHLVTGLICLGAITRSLGRPPDPRFGWALLICSNAVDLDHLPLEFGSRALTAGTPRPYTHALWVAAVLIVAALAVRSWPRGAGTPASATTARILPGAACGVCDHFMRDIATAPMSMWWPLTNAAVRVSYWWYVAVIVVIAASPVIPRSRDGRFASLYLPEASRRRELDAISNHIL
jgi:inner membrane protein